MVLAMDGSRLAGGDLGIEPGYNLAGEVCQSWPFWSLIADGLIILLPKKTLPAVFVLNRQDGELVEG